MKQTVIIDTFFGIFDFVIVTRRFMYLSRVSLAMKLMYRAQIGVRVKALITKLDNFVGWVSGGK